MWIELPIYQRVHGLRTASYFTLGYDAGVLFVFFFYGIKAQLMTTV